MKATNVSFNEKLLSIVDSKLAAFIVNAVMVFVIQRDRLCLKEDPVVVADCRYRSPFFPVTDIHNRELESMLGEERNKRTRGCNCRIEEGDLEQGNGQARSGLKS